MKVGVVQMDCRRGNAEANLETLASFAEKAGREGCDVVVFPEMIDTGYDMAVIKETAATWEEKPFLQVQRSAVTNRIHIICSLSERSGGRIFNTTLVMDPEGNPIGKYRKNHLADYPPLNEGSCITPGDSLEMVEIGNLSFGLTICYDLRFPEMNRQLALMGADVLVLSSAWPLQRLRHWNTLISARAIENQVYLVAANRVGTDGSTTFCGSSRVIDPYGVTVAAAAEEGETLITGTIDRALIEQVREKMPVFRHRTDLDRL